MSLTLSENDVFCQKREHSPCRRPLSQLQLFGPAQSGRREGGGSGRCPAGVPGFRGLREHPGDPVGVVPPPLALGDALLYRQPGGGGPAAQLGGPALLGNLGSSGTLGVRPALLQRLGRPRRPLLHRLHPQPVRYLHRPILGGQLPAALLRHRHRKARLGGGGRSLGSLGRHICRAPVWLEGARPGRRLCV